MHFIAIPRLYVLYNIIIMLSIFDYFYLFLLLIILLDCRDVNGNRTQSAQDIAASRRLLSPANRATPIAVPVPAARLPSSPVYIPITGSAGTAGSLGMQGGSQQQRVSLHGINISDMNRAAPISIPTAHISTSGPIPIRPGTHRGDASVVPPSYEEATAEHSCGESMESINELPDTLLVSVFVGFIQLL